LRRLFAAVPFLLAPFAANMTEVGGQRNADGLARGPSLLYLNKAFST
jgi:hypothetical protein